MVCKERKVEHSGRELDRYGQKRTKGSSMPNVVKHNVNSNRFGAR